MYLTENHSSPFKEKKKRARKGISKAELIIQNFSVDRKNKKLYNLVSTRIPTLRISLYKFVHWWYALKFALPDHVYFIIQNGLYIFEWKNTYTFHN